MANLTRSLVVIFLIAVRCQLVLLQNAVCRPDLSRDDCGYSSAVQCVESGCCFDNGGGTPSCYHPTVPPVNPQCLPEVTRIQCGLPKITSEGECGASGCCWNHSWAEPPYCYFSSPTYLVQSINKTEHGLKLVLRNSIDVGSKGQIAAPISPLLLELTRETDTRLHVKITDPNTQRYEIPPSLLPVPPPPARPLANYYYDYEFAEEGKQFYMIIKRRYSGQVVFNTSSIRFIFTDNFLTIGTTLPPDHNVYGLGEHKTSLKLKPHTYTLWNCDVPTPEDVNLYGSHPFYLEMRGGKAHGVFLRNSNGMDVVLGDTSLTYRVIGGVLDFYFFVGEMGQPDEVIHSYQEVIGRPAMPPYWALGFHQSRWGYGNLEQVKEMVGNFTKAKIPLDTVWLDIDYMDAYRDFTTNSTSFPVNDVRNFISDLHKNGMHFVVIVDPAISSESSDYQPYKDGIGMDIFIKDYKDDVFVGKVWPGLTVYPDFLHPNITKYWEKQISLFMKRVPVDGLWIDMNEPSNFCYGSCYRELDAYSRHSHLTGFNLYNPPYYLNSQDKFYSLQFKTLDVDSKQYGGQLFFNTHNLYGFTEAIATRRALLSINKGKRPFVLSRSTFAGSGVHTAHWLGDNTASADDLYYSIPGILNFQMFGVPLVGADICGFGGTTTEELCGRWMQLGALYPFSRNHNTQGAPSQEPYRWNSVALISRKMLSIRYSLLPYFYTLLYKAHHDYTDITIFLPSPMVLKPLFFEFYEDPKCLSIDHQFLVGSAILVSPQLRLGEKGKSLDVYLPPAKWYDWYTYGAVTDKGGVNMTIPTPMDHMPIHVRGGHIIPMQGAGMTTTSSRGNPYSLLVALDVDSGSPAFGDLYLDDGETLNTTEYTYMTYTCEGQQLNGYTHGNGYATKHSLPSLTMVTVLGVTTMPSVVSLDGKPVVFSTSLVRDTFVLNVTQLSVPMGTNFALNWI